MSHRKERLRMFLDNAAALLYPHRCPVCGEISGVGETVTHAHPACVRKLIRVTEPTCLLCGKPIPDDTSLYCGDCEKHNGMRLFDAGAALWVYDRQMQRSISDFKYHGMRCYTDFYVREAAEKLAPLIEFWKPEVICPVPVNRRKRIQRGYNQAELLAAGISRYLGIPWDGRLLVRSRYTAPQKALGPEERRKNLARAFKPGPHAGRYKSILLVDDIYTTGSTMQCCSEVLKNCGARKVFIFSLCIGSER